MDTLYAEGIASSNGLSCTEFSFPNSAEESSIDPVNVHDSSLRLASLHSLNSFIANVVDNEES